MPPRVRVVRRGESARDRAAQRQTMGPLRAQLISSRAGKRYAAAVDIFTRYLWYILGVALDLSDLASWINSWCLFWRHCGLKATLCR